MAIPDFDLKLPATLGEALALAAVSPPPLLMAGGTDLMVQLKQGLRSAATLVSLSRVADLRKISEKDGTVSLGGGVTVAALEASGLLARRLPGLVDAARAMATVQIRQRATVAGNLVTAAACADLAPILAALDVKVVLRSARAERSVPIASFFTGPRQTVLAADEILVSAEVPSGVPGSGSAYVKFGYRRGAQIAVASAAAWLKLEGGTVRAVRLVLGAVAPIPLVVRGAQVLVGERPEGAPLEAACAAASTECKPISDIRGSEAYRRAVVAVVARQAIERAALRAEGRTP